MKLVKHYLEGIDGVATYPLISMVIFITFFVGILYWIYKMPKKQITEMSNLPLENDSSN